MRQGGDKPAHLLGQVKRSSKDAAGRCVVKLLNAAELDRWCSQVEF